MRRLDAGLPIFLREQNLRFEFGADVFGPEAEMRSLNQIRPSLLDPRSDGPDPVYGICMDIGRTRDREELQRRWLLFGAVAFAAGRLGEEPVRSQGHVHAIAPHSGWSPPELFEIWQGQAIIYAQECDGHDPGRCFAVLAGPGDHVIVPPAWPHFVANADPGQPMVFGALCDRQYGFIYDGVRARHGLAWFPVCDGDVIRWRPNPHYAPSALRVGTPGSCIQFGVKDGVSLYKQFEDDADTLQWVSEPERMRRLWPSFEPIGKVQQEIRS
jgi:glucose-6-phosphate isomerase, archaeal